MIDELCDFIINIFVSILSNQGATMNQAISSDVQK